MKHTCTLHPSPTFIVNSGFELERVKLAGVRVGSGRIANSPSGHVRLYGLLNMAAPCAGTSPITLPVRQTRSFSFTEHGDGF